MNEETIRYCFEEQTGLKATVVTQIGVGLWMVTAEDGSAYTMRTPVCYTGVL
jgi:hypothetical protein